METLSTNLKVYKINENYLRIVEGNIDRINMFISNLNSLDTIINYENILDNLYTVK